MRPPTLADAINGSRRQRLFAIQRRLGQREDPSRQAHEETTLPKRTLAALVFPGFELLDLYGPLEMFGISGDDFELRVVAEGEAPVASKQGPAARVDESFAAGRQYDLLLVPGGMGTRREVENKALTGWIAAQAEQAELVMSVCTGAALLARAGLLDGRRATSNKLAFGWVRSQGPRVEWVAAARWVEDGKLFTSSGVSAGMDMSLAVIARLLGSKRARETAVFAEYDWQDDPAHDPYAAIHGLV